jgi:hypothetical protein
MLDTLRSRLSFLKNPLPRDALRAGVGYIRRNPGELLTVAKAAAGRRATVPLDALRWLSDHAPKGKKGPKDLVIGAASPALSFGVTSELMGNEFRATGEIFVEDIVAGPDDLRITIRVANLKLQALAGENTPMGNLFKAMDLSKPASLLSFLPQRPPAIVEASGDRFTLDLLKVPKIASNPVVRRALEVVTPVVAITEIRTENDHLVMGFRPKSGGLSSALAALRR